MKRASKISSSPSSPVAASNSKTQQKTSSYSFTPDKFDEYEFGGPIGALAVMAFSHIIVYYLWICLAFNDGAVFVPKSVQDLLYMVDLVKNYAYPSWFACKVYLGFLTFETLIGMFLPGFKTFGHPIRSEGGKKLPYLCNAYQSWLLSCGLVCLSQYMGWINMARIVDHHGELITMAMIVADSLALCVYVSALVRRHGTMVSGNPIYDYFMGINLNPRIGILDIKLFCEVRISWMILFFLTFSAACKQYEQYGYVANSMIILLIGHAYYINACSKGEELILSCWDVVFERFGWLLSFWNLCGVPFSYCFGSMFLARRPPLDLPWWFAISCIVVLLFAAYIHDTGNAQKNSFRQVLDGTFRKRYTFPQLPWAILKNPKYMDTECGSKLLIDGWFKYARKLTYTADIVMAGIWGLACGFTHFLPYFYFVFFLGMITHRYYRDVDRMKKKYGKDYDRYCAKVPYVYIPGLF